MYVFFTYTHTVRITCINQSRCKTKCSSPNIQKPTERKTHTHTQRLNSFFMARTVVSTKHFLIECDGVFIFYFQVFSFVNNSNYEPITHFEHKRRRKCQLFATHLCAKIESIWDWVRNKAQYGLWLLSTAIVACYV